MRAGDYSVIGFSFMEVSLIGSRVNISFSGKIQGCSTEDLAKELGLKGLLEESSCDRSMESD